MSAARRAPPEAARRGWCPGVARPMPTGDGLLARIHPPLGMLAPTQARAAAEGARRFGNGHVDVTARANLQIRGVTEATRAPLARLLDAAGLGDVRGDGGPQRLTLTSPLAGADPAELFDVPALARAIEAAGLSVPGLPAKTLVAVEGRPGTRPADADFSVTALGPGRVGVAMAGADAMAGFAARTDTDAASGPVDCAASYAPRLLAALLAAFARTGRRRARDLTEDERAALAREMRAVDRRTPLPQPSPTAGPPSPAQGGGSAGGAAPAHPAAGLTPLGPTRTVVAVEAPFGRCTADALDRLAAAAEAAGADAVRLSPTRGFVLLAADPDRAAAALAGLAVDFIAAPNDARRWVAACTGAPACASGTTPTLADAARLSGAFGPLAALGLRAHLSGCAKGCAHPAPADLTLVGRGGLYGAIVGGAPGDEPALLLPIGAVLERIGRAATVGLAAAFAPDRSPPGRGRDGRPG